MECDGSNFKKTLQIDELYIRARKVTLQIGNLSFLTLTHSTFARIRSSRTCWCWLRKYSRNILAVAEKRDLSEGGKNKNRLFSKSEPQRILQYSQIRKGQIPIVLYCSDWEGVQSKNLTDIPVYLPHYIMSQYPQ